MKVKEKARDAFWLSSWDLDKKYGGPETQTDFWYTRAIRKHMSGGGWVLISSNREPANDYDLNYCRENGLDFRITLKNNRGETVDERVWEWPCSND